MAFVEDFEKRNKIEQDVPAETKAYAYRQAKAAYLSFLGDNALKITKEISGTKPRKANQSAKALQHDLRLIKMVGALSPEDFMDYMRKKELDIVERNIEHFAVMAAKIKDDYTRIDLLNKLDILHDYKAELATSPNANFFLASRLVASNGQSGRWAVSDFLLNNYLMYQCPSEILAAEPAKEQC